MTYREFLNNLSDADFADAIINDTLFDIACAEGPIDCNTADTRFMEPEKCTSCVIKLLKSEFEESLI